MNTTITCSNVVAQPIPELTLTARPRSYTILAELEECGRILNERPEEDRSVYDLAARGELDDHYIRSLIEAAM